MEEINTLLAQNPVKDSIICRTYGYTGKDKNECSKECPYYIECRQWLWDITNLIVGLKLHISIISEN